MHCLIGALRPTRLDGFSQYSRVKLQINTECICFSKTVVGQTVDSLQTVICRTYVRIGVSSDRIASRTIHYMVERKHTNEKHQENCKFFSTILKNLCACPFNWQSNLGYPVWVFLYYFTVLFIEAFV